MLGSHVSLRQVDEQVDIPVLQNVAGFFRRQVCAKRNDRCPDCVQSEPMKVEIRAAVQLKRDVVASTVARVPIARDDALDAVAGLLVGQIDEAAGTMCRNVKEGAIAMLASRTLERFMDARIISVIEIGRSGPGHSGIQRFMRSNISTRVLAST